MLLTADPARHAERALAAAQANMQAGVFSKALDLLAEAEDQGSGPLGELASARVEVLRGQIAFASGLGSDAPLLLLKAAKRLESLDVGLARETYLSAWMAALFAGRLAAGGDLLEVSRTARALPLPAEPRTVDLVLDALALIMTGGPAAAAPTLRRAVSAFAGADITAAEALRWGWLAQAAASALWDNDAWHALLLRQVRLAREAGALGQLPVMLDALGTAVAASGDFAAASALIVEADTIRAVTAARAVPLTAMMLAALRGRQAEAGPLIEATIAEAQAGGQGIAVAYAYWAAAILLNGLGRYEEAQTAACQASEDITELHISMWALPELVEAAARAGQAGLAKMRSSSWRRLRSLAATIPRSASRRGAGHCSAMTQTPTSSIVKRSTDWAVPGCVQSWRARTCCTESGCAARAGASRRASSCASPTTCSPRSA